MLKPNSKLAEQQASNRSNKRHDVASDLFTQHEAFGTKNQFTVGIEHEYGLVNAFTGQPVNAFDEVYDDLEPSIQQRCTNEFLGCQIEFATGVHEDVESAAGEVIEIDTELIRVCDRLGLRVLRSGTFPDWKFDPALIHDCERSRRNLQRFGGEVAGLACNSMHVHVQVSRDDAIAVMDRLMCHVPRWVAMSANSPSMYGHGGKFASHRAMVWGREGAITGFPYRFGGSWEAYYYEIARLHSAGLVETQKDAYFMVRPTRFGTIEVRCCDIPVDLQTTIAIAEEIQAAAINAVGDTSPMPSLEQLTEDFGGACRLGRQWLRRGEPSLN
ncbi:carboxylate-amine ligase [Novipirellula maiorica]|nr:glutamate-cysteine ligase family protein [Rhodopirellula maiorica]